MNDEEALFGLQEEYEFTFVYFSSLAPVTRVLARLNFSQVGMDGRLHPQKFFYFEVHCAEVGKPVVYFPSDSYVPDAIEAGLGVSRVIFPSVLKRIFGLDPLKRAMTFPYTRGAFSPSVEQVRAVLGLVGAKRHSFRIKSDVREEGLGISIAEPKDLPKKKFLIKNIEGEIEERPIDELNYDNLEIISSHKPHDFNAGQIIISEEAWAEISTHVSFGNTTASNVVEQGGVYVGTPCVLSNGRRVGIVKTAIPAANTSGSGTYVEFSHDTWKHFMRILEVKRELGECDRDDVILGWYHTHPNSLDVFMSGTDMGTQREQFYRSWNSAIVINPHRRLIAGFYGGQASPAEVLLRQEQ